MKLKNHLNISIDISDTYKEIHINQGKFRCALVIDTQLNSLSQETQVCINVLQVEYIYIINYFEQLEKKLC